GQNSFATISATIGCEESQQGSRLFDDLVGAGDQRRWHVEIEQTGCLGVDDQLEPGRLQYRQVWGLGALEDLAGIDADLPVHLWEEGSVAHQPADLGIVAQRINRRNRIAHREQGKLNAPAVEESVAADKKGVELLARKRGEGRINLAARAGIEHVDLQPGRAAPGLQVSQGGLGV